MRQLIADIADARRGLSRQYEIKEMHFLLTETPIPAMWRAATGNINRMLAKPNYSHRQRPRRAITYETDDAVMCQISIKASVISCIEVLLVFTVLCFHGPITHLIFRVGVLTPTRFRPSYLGR